MIESLVSVFTRNNSIISKKVDSGGGGFQETLSKYDQSVDNDQYQKFNDNTYDYQEENQYRDYDEYSSSDEPEYSDSEDVDVDETQAIDDDSKSSEATEDERSDRVNKEILAEMATLLEHMGISKEDIAQINKALASGEGGIIKEELSRLLSTLKDSLKQSIANGSPELKGAAEFTQKLENLLNTKDANMTRDIADLVKSSLKNLNKNPVTKEGAAIALESNVENKTDKDIKLNNTKFAEMKEVAQGTKSIKFRTDVDPRFAQEAQKPNQTVQDKLVQTNLAAKAAGGQAGSSGNNQGNNGATGDPAGQSPDFLKKMKTILKVNSQPSQLGEAVQENLNKLQNNMLRPSFMNRATAGKFMQQLTQQVQNMLNSKSTLSASVDFKTAEFGDMKLAAEAQGANLSVKLSNIASNMRLDIQSLKGELDTELKNLGFDNVELDFGSEGESSSKHAFHEEMNKRLGKDQVKLPGDHIADLNAINEWMKNSGKVM